MGRAAIEIFFRIAARLGASALDEATLLGVSLSEIERYHAGTVPEARDTLERISHVTAIWIDLVTLFRTEKDARQWLRSPHQKFGGCSPLERMLAGNVSDLVDVRYEVEATHLM